MFEKEVGNSLLLLNIKTGLLWDGIKSLLSLLLLEFKGDTSDWLGLDFLINSSSESSNLILDLFALDVGDLLDDLLVEIEIFGEFTVEFLDNLSRSSFDDLILNSTHEFIKILIF